MIVDSSERSLKAFLKTLPQVDEVGVHARTATLATRSIKTSSKAWAIDMAISMVDLTTLEGADTPGKVRAICAKAVRPDATDLTVPSVGAVCVYNDMVQIARSTLDLIGGKSIPVAAVATAFPSGRKVVVLTNACGGINREYAVGQPVLIRDHISLTAVSPLIGADFVDLTDLYSKRIRGILRAEDPTLAEGVYAHWRGPSYETPAEINMIRIIGGDLVGMSTVPEAIAAHALGAEVVAISLVSNAAAGITGEKLSHEEVMAAGKAAAGKMGELLSKVLHKI